MNSLTSDTPRPVSDAEEGVGARWFVVTSLGFLLLSCLMLAGRPDFLLSPVLTGHGLSWMALMLLGTAFCGVFGVVYWAVPKVFGTPLYSEKFVFLHYGFHLTGMVLALASVIWPEFTRGAMGMMFIACGAIVFAVNLLGTFHRPAKPDVACAYLMASAVWLVIAAFLGLPFAAEAPVGFLAQTNWSEAWLILAMAGVALNMPMGIALRVTPHAMGIPMVKTGTAWYALAFSNAGLAWMFPATAFGPMQFLIFCAVVYLAGVLIYFAEYFSILQRRAVRVLSWDAKILLTAFSLVPVAAVFLMISAWQHIPPPPAEPVPGVPPPVEEEVVKTGVLPLEFLPVDAATVLTVLLAIVVPAIVALAFQLIRLQNSVAADPRKQSTRERLAEQILLASFFNYATGVLLVIPGAWVGIAQMLSLGTLFLLMGAIGFAGNFFFSSSAGSPADSQKELPPAAQPAGV